VAADWFFERLAEWGDRAALITNDRPTTYVELLRQASAWRERFEREGVQAGQVVALEGSFSAEACGAFLAGLGLGVILVPLVPQMRAHRSKFLTIAEASLLVELEAEGGAGVQKLDARVTNALTQKLGSRGNPGLVIFSSGSTGAPKAILHDLSAILEKFRKVRQSKRTLTFLLFTAAKSSFAVASRSSRLAT
jgi:acyl-coenzyme A synthetase/AMP-(fatty) acid ligase